MLLDRNWQSFEIISRELKKLPLDTEIIQGCARCADIMSANIAKVLKFIENSRGTKNMIKQSKNRGIKVILIKE